MSAYEFFKLAVYNSYNCTRTYYEDVFIIMGNELGDKMRGICLFGLT